MRGTACPRGQSGGESLVTKLRPLRRWRKEPQSGERCVWRQKSEEGPWSSTVERFEVKLGPYQKGSGRRRFGLRFGRITLPGSGCRIEGKEL